MVTSEKTTGASAVSRAWRMVSAETWDSGHLARGSFSPDGQRDLACRDGVQRVRGLDRQQVQPDRQVDIVLGRVVQDCPQPQREAMGEMRGKVQEMRGQLQKDRADFKEKAQDMRDDMRAQGQQMRDDMKKQMEGATTPEARKALVDEMKAKRDAFQDQKQGMQDKIREGKQQFVKKNLDIASMRFGGVVQQFDSIVARMSDFVAKKKTEGKDVAALETSLAAAKTAVDAAKADINKVADISKTVTANTAGATDKAAIKTAVQAANDSIKKAQKDFSRSRCKLQTLTTLSDLLPVAQKIKKITQDQTSLILRFIQNPHEWL
jgi:hypothetical protein